METSARYSLIGGFTLAIVLIALSFVYWLHNTGGFGAKTMYRVTFERTAGGLLVGSPVQFNGIKVGEVSALSLDQHDPRRVEAVIAVDAATPVRQDTAVTIEAQGLTGSPALALTGGDPAAAALAAGAPLAAARGAGLSINQSAREVLARIDGILSDNAEPLHKLIADLQTFSSALSRNSERVDTILAGLERMTGGAAKGPAAIVQLAAPANLPAVTPPAGTLIVPEPAAALAINSDKLMVRQPNGELLPAPGVQWEDAVPALVQGRLMQAFENAGAGMFVVRQSDSAGTGPRLQIEIRDFSVDSAPTASGIVELAARLVGENGTITAAKVFRASHVVESAGSVAQAHAVDQAFQDCAAQIVPWAVSLAQPRPHPAAPAAPPKR